MESERQKLMEDIQMNHKKMNELEDNLLYRLTSTKGSLVDDEDLINVLNVTKVFVLSLYLCIADFYYKYLI